MPFIARDNRIGSGSDGAFENMVIFRVVLHDIQFDTRLYFSGSSVHHGQRPVQLWLGGFELIP
jgi:hypothetical protein